MELKHLIAAICICENLEEEKKLEKVLQLNESIANLKSFTV